jgi:hypothetical protein
MEANYLKKLHFFLYPILIIILFIQVEKNNSLNEVYKRNEMTLFYEAIHDFSRELLLLSDTLLLYSENFTEEGNEVYLRTLKLHYVSINRIENDLRRLTDYNSAGMFNYYNYVSFLNYKLMGINKYNLSETRMHNLGEVIGRYGKEIHQSIGPLGIDVFFTEEGSRRILTMLQSMNEEIEVIFEKVKVSDLN